MADKAALIVEQVPRDRLMDFLEGANDEAPAPKKARTAPIGPPSRGAGLLTDYCGVAAASGEPQRPAASEAASASVGEPASGKPAGGGAAGGAPEQSPTEPEQLGLQERRLPDLEMADGGGCKRTALEPVGVDAEASTADTLSEGTPGSPTAGSADSTGTPRSPKESVIVHALRHLDAFEVFSKKRFSHWAPVTMPGLCGHPTGPSGKLCNDNAGDCLTHLRRELDLMASEDRLSGIAERGFCGVPGRDGKRCEKARGYCDIHTEAWHEQRELAAMKSEDDASCVADRGICGVTPRAGGAPCGKPKGRCPTHAEGDEQCRSALDDDPGARCRKYRRGSSDFCEFHQDRPNFCLALTKFFAEREGELLTEDALRAWDRSRFPDAVQALDVYDFQRYIAGRAKACGFQLKTRISGATATAAGQAAPPEASGAVDVVVGQAVGEQVS